MKISKKFNLNKSQNELDFVDIDTNKDMMLFIDPYRISKLSGPFIDKANEIINNYFSYLVELLATNDFSTAKKIFSHLSEVNETCLGYSIHKPNGKGLGKNKLNDKVFNSLKNSQAVGLNILESLEDIKIFVEGVNSDRISDMTANIIRKLLIEYTQDQCELFNISLTSNIASGMFWDTDSRSWKQELTNMLVINKKRYLLVPKIIVSYGDKLDSGTYYEQFVLNFFQDENIKDRTDLVQYRKGKKNKNTPFVTKKDVKEKQLGTEKEPFFPDKNWLANFTSAHGRVFKDFKNNTFKNMKNIDYNENRSDIAKYLIDKLKSIKPGKEFADEYHITMMCILEFIFYPNISSPKKEVSINEGRKRIDIVFNNTASDGFFFDLFEKYDIPANFIMVECKNYSVDINNPELDQLLGRFSKHRGKFGISTSRYVNDGLTLTKRCNDIYNDSDNLIIPLLDKDVIEILEKIEEYDEDAGEKLLLSKYTEIVFPYKKEEK